MKVLMKLKLNRKNDPLNILSFNFCSETQTKRDTERKRHTGRARHIQRESETERDKHRQRELYTDWDRHRQKEMDRKLGAKTERATDR